MTYFQGTFEKRCSTTGAPTELSFFSTGVLLLLNITNIPGNVLIVLGVVIDPNRNLRTPFNWLIANLAIADLIVGTITVPMSAYFTIKEGLDLPIPMAEVKVIHVTYFISCTASVLSISVLAVERYQAVVRPNLYHNGTSVMKRILMTVVGIWFTAITLSMLYLEVGYITFAFIFANTAILVVFVITIFTYCLILRQFRMRQENLANTSSSAATISFNNVMVSSSSTIQTGAGSSCNSIVNSARMMEMKVARMFGVILVAFVCCYVTSTILIYVMAFCESCSCSVLHWCRDLEYLFVIANSNVNFYCYALQSPRFRSSFSKILRLKCKRRRPYDVSSDRPNAQ